MYIYVNLTMSFESVAKWIPRISDDTQTTKPTSIDRYTRASQNRNGTTVMKTTRPEAINRH